MPFAVLEWMMIPPELRALARVVSDVDYSQFPELSTLDSLNPPVRELGRLLTDITGSPLSAKEFRLFQTVLMEVKHHLRGVDAETMAESQVGGALALTMRLDATCTEADVPLALVFPHVKAAHNFFLEIMFFKFSVKQTPVFYRLSDAMCALLLRALSELQRYADMLTAGTAPDSALKVSPSGNHCVGNLVDDEALPWLRESVSLPIEFECVFADIDGDVGVHLAHLRWYVKVCRQSIFFDSGTYVGDVSARKLWGAYVGNNVPACFAEAFAPALQFFPEWSRAPIMDVLNYRQCGVVSLYTLRRLLSVWGPFLLLDRNMKEGMRLGLYDLGHSLEYHLKAFAQRPDAEAGDCVATLTETPGEVVALMLLRHDEGSLSTRMVRFTQHTGAWVPEGLTAEEYDTVHDACCAFPELFRRPCGTCYGLSEQPRGSSTQVDFSATVSHTASSLHRACFRNNERYVKTLLARGSAVVVNTALVDPVISSRFCWTPLLCAVNNPNSDPGNVVRMLLEVGADVHICDDAQCTALYYAIANGYVDAARVLLEHCPQLRTSASSEALLVALGAHHFHARESDIRRLSDLIPSHEMLDVLLRYQWDLRLVRLGVDIIAGKLCDVERLQQPMDDPAVWHPDGEVELRTPEEEVHLSKIIAYHSRLCRLFSGDVSRAARLLYNHAYFLSCREHFRQGGQESEGGNV